MPTFRQRLATLADAARFDAPCAARAHVAAPPPAGAPATRGRAAVRAPLPVWDRTEVEPAAIYWSVAGDGRRVPLLRLLLTNHCLHDCAYCPLRRSNAEAERARLGVAEVVRLTLD